jgi:GNAT superfamily N-acetyltransferase
VRPAEPRDIDFMWTMLAETVNWRSSADGVPLAELRDDDRVVRYLDSWAREGDTGQIVEDENGEPIAAAWYRLMTVDRPGYGYIDASTPESSIGVRPGSRGRGVGTVLITTLLQDAADAGIADVCLSVEGDNPTRRLYERLCFARVGGSGGAWTMRRSLTA